jgi:hypothetical protein
MPSQTPLLKAASARIDASQVKKSFAKNYLLSRQSVAMSLLRLPFSVYVETWLAKSSAPRAALTTALKFSNRNNIASF